jgi:hypothetical protein
MSTRIGIVLVMFLSITHAQETSNNTNPHRTAGRMNGRAWRLMGNYDKRIYLEGYENGSTAMAVAMAVIKIHNANISAEVLFQVAEEQGLNSGGFTMLDYLRELDVLYSDTENVNISVPDGIAYCHKKLSGKYTKAELEKQLIVERTYDNKNVGLSSQDVIDRFEKSGGFSTVKH